ncbi:MAG: putative branched-chain amino acid permease involved in azaleucine resistance [Candidatus Methanohalarchaeum thermophilum]|uniref:Branched-chain amino acid permease involved in azaleucine resistance n=1 Tax=Methanohalarchaeum thermophilum TaxID=1903181 RepID=A0A1Q6DWP9_METT1|nr:MAG: putative branched-chain amino acid permease involved in azaleucine resistance [Candidatus Methanohalarchaeum thermophilum]
MNEKQKIQLNQFTEGCQNSIPILLGYLPIGLAFGVLANNAGISPVNSLLMSLLVFAGASQFIAIGLIEKGITTFSIILTTFLVNSRHILMSASLSPYFQKINSWKSSLLSFGITDETFALNSVELKEDQTKNHYYIAGVHLTAYIAWVSSTAIGAYLGNYVTNPNALGLNFALPAMFLALIIIQITDKNDITVAITSMITILTLLPYLGSELTLIVTTIFAATIGAVIKR